MEKNFRNHSAKQKEVYGVFGTVNPKYLLQGSLEGKIAVPINSKTTIFVAPGHDVRRAEANYKGYCGRYNSKGKKGGAAVFDPAKDVSEVISGDEL